ncbi:MAG: DNA polymerase III [Spirochaetaceae bacterium]|jgi:DNA polymerase-3 subunit gamma/tau|nr:DNA polymerase III [Spirochaetaceae bacterium]
MFENVLSQEAANQLSADIRGDKLAPSMLFAGPAASGKGTAALELGRVLSCEKDASWNCPCPSCARHRLLYHPDLLAVGSRPFSPEIAAAAEVFVRENAETPARILFIRAVRKLLLRFNPVLWEDEPRFSKLFPLLEALEDGLNEITAGEASGSSAENTARAEKLAASIRKSAFKLEADGIADHVPVSQIRHASYWMRLAPLGRRKFLLIENADRMQDAARNALLKILEEPPDRALIVLATSRAPALLPTIVSRLRPYQFRRRDETVEKDVIRRVFRGVEAPSAAGVSAAARGSDSLITGYLESFLPVSGGKLYPLAAFFAASLAAQALFALKNQNPSLLPPAEIVALGKYAAPIAESAGLGRPAKDTGACIVAVLAGADRFEAPGLFPHFLSQLLGLVSRNFRAAPSGGSPQTAPEAAGRKIPSPGDTSRFAGIFRELAAEAASAVGTYNIGAELALEKFCAAFTQRILESAV